MIRRIAMSAAVAAVLYATTAHAALPAQKCEAGKNKVAGQYATCLHKAQLQFVIGGEVDTVGRDAAVMACGDKYADKWQTLETKATPGVCPSESDATSIQDFLDACIFSVEDALGGATLPLDVTTCNSNLATCNAGTATAADVASGKTFSSSAGLGLTGTLTYCGDGSQDAGEQCDGTDFDPLLTCAGGCLTSCLCRFVDNGNLTVTDNRTHLIWEKKFDCTGCVHDKDNTYSWSSAASAPDGTAFTSFLATLNDAGGGTCPSGGPVGGCCVFALFTQPCEDPDCFTGHCDWRLPTVAELQSILTAPSPCGINPCVDAIFGLARTDIFWWTSATVGSSATGGWHVDFANGNTSTSTKTNGYFVRAVRSGS